MRVAHPRAPTVTPVQLYFCYGISKTECLHMWIEGGKREGCAWQHASMGEEGGALRALRGGGARYARLGGKGEARYARFNLLQIGACYARLCVHINVA